MTVSPKVVIGVPLYNKADYLVETLESLLAQTYRDFVLVMVDDSSTDETQAVVERYAAIDPRIIYRRNPRRLGMIRNWRRAFEIARALFPEAPYFAWASDHDIWHPRWLAALVRELDRAPDVVLTYPLVIRTYPSGSKVRSTRPFDSTHIADPRERFRATFWGMTPGNMVYGLFHAQALERAGVFRPVLLPDRLLMAELSLIGPFRQVYENLWFRRIFKNFSLERQRASFFPDGNPPYVHLPWWLVHGLIVFWTLTVRGMGRPHVGRITGAALALSYMRMSISLDLQRARHPLRKVAQAASKKASTRYRSLRRRLLKTITSRVRRRLARIKSRGYREFRRRAIRCVHQAARVIRRAGRTGRLIMRQRVASANGRLGVGTRKARPAPAPSKQTGNAGEIGKRIGRPAMSGGDARMRLAKTPPMRSPGSADGTGPLDVRSGVDTAAGQNGSSPDSATRSAVRESADPGGPGARPA